jgi:hypothetical protein
MNNTFILTKGDYLIKTSIIDNQIVSEPLDNATSSIVHLGSLDRGNYKVSINSKDNATDKYLVSIMYSEVDSFVTEESRFVAVRVLSPGEYINFEILAEINKPLYVRVQPLKSSNYPKLGSADLVLSKDLSSEQLGVYCYSGGLSNRDFSNTEGALKVNKISDNDYEIILPVNTGEQLLYFPQSYHKDWIALAVSPDGEKTKLEHIEYMHGNAWKINDGNNSIIRVTFNRGPSLISLVSLSLAVILLLQLFYGIYLIKQKQ